MSVYGTDTLSCKVDKNHILILSNACRTLSLHVHTRFSGILVSLNLKQVQNTTYAALGMDLGLTDLLSKLKAQYGLLLLSDHDWRKGIFDGLEHLPESIYGQCCSLKVLEFLLALDVPKGKAETAVMPQNCAYCNRSILAAQTYMKEHLSEKVTIADLSRIVSLSPTYLKTEFHRACGKPIHRWFVELRMQRAAERIRCTELPIYQIAQEVGYESMSQFTSAFRKQYGVTPGEYKKMSKSETECPIPR